MAVFAFLALAGLVGLLALNTAQPAQAASHNVNLAELKVMYGPTDLLAGSFNADETFYEVDAAGNRTSVTVSAKADDSNAVVELPGAAGVVTLGTGPTDLAVAVRNGDASKVYFVRITPYGTNDLKSLEITRGDPAVKVALTPAFSPGIRAYTASVPNGITEVDVTATLPMGSSAALSASGTAAPADANTAGAPFQALLLAPPPPGPPGRSQA